MSLSSDEESSGSSSDEYLVTADKINFDSSFFQQTTSKNHKASIPENDESSNDSDDDFSFDDDNKVDSAALLAEVMKNLENAKKNETSLIDNTKNFETTSLKKDSPRKTKNNVLSDEIANLLLQGESGVSSLADDQNDEEENVDEAKPEVYEIPKEGVNITLPGSAMMQFKRKKKIADNVEDMLRKKMNQRLRSNQIFIHKVGLMCWLAHGFHLNREINDPEILSTALSLVPSTSYPKGRPDLKYLEQFTKWFKNLFKLEFKDISDVVKKEILLIRLREKKVHNYRELVLLYVATLRAMGINCRIVVSLCPPALKLSSDQLFQNPNPDKSGGDGSKTGKSNVKAANKETLKKGGKKGGKGGKSKNDGIDLPSKIIPENSAEVMENTKSEARKRAAQVLAKFANTPNKKSIKTIIEKKEDGMKVGTSPKTKQEEAKSPPRTRQLRSRAIEVNSQTKSVKENKTATIDKETVKEEKSPARSTRAAKTVKLEIPSTSAQVDGDSDDEFEEKTMKKRRTKTLKNLGKNIEMDNDSDEEFIPKEPVKKRKIDASKKESKNKSTARDSIDRRVLSSDEEQIEIVDAKSAQNIWVEVYVESEESWISVSVPDDKIHCVSEIYKKAPKPVLYIVGWNTVGTLKDVTRRYCPHWLTVTRKQRIDEKWWMETLDPWKEKKTAISKAEDEMLLQKELEQPLPKTVGECKGHPLYALARHLLKFEALYPPDCKPLGYVRSGEAIYSRHCVHTLMSRETWLKKARVVKPKQDAYKIVKAMPKYDKLSGIKLKDQPLELFGKWQTTQYEPPEAKNGIVPRNEYGNVDLFQASMLPKGTVHINREYITLIPNQRNIDHYDLAANVNEIIHAVPALNRVARKLNIDCSPAVVGFNFGCRGALPAFEGFVVCEEFEDTLREAWEADQIESMKRAKEKRENRIYGNWKKLIKGLFIRERLAARYDFKNSDNEEDKKLPKPVKRPVLKAGETKKVKKAKTS